LSSSSSEIASICSGGANVVEHAGHHLDAPIHFLRKAAFPADKVGFVERLVSALRSVTWSIRRAMRSRLPLLVRRRLAKGRQEQAAAAGCMSSAISFRRGERDRDIRYRRAVEVATKLYRHGNMNYQGLRRSGRMAASRSAQSTALACRNHVARKQRYVAGVQDPPAVAAIGQLGASSTSPSRQGAGGTAHMVGRALQGEGFDRLASPGCWRLVVRFTSTGVGEVGHAKEDRGGGGDRASANAGARVTPPRTAFGTVRPSPCRAGDCNSSIVPFDCAGVSNWSLIVADLRISLVAMRRPASVRVALRKPATKPAPWRVEGCSGDMLGVVLQNAISQR